MLLVTGAGEPALVGEQVVRRGRPAGIPGADLRVECHHALNLAAALRYRRRAGACPLGQLADPSTAIRLAMHGMGHRIARLDTEVTALGTDLDALVAPT